MFGAQDLGFEVRAFGGWDLGFSEFRWVAPSSVNLTDLEALGWGHGPDGPRGNP